MNLLNIVSGILFVTTGLGIYAGLDKLSGSFIFLALTVAGLYCNSFFALISREGNKPLALMMRRGINRGKADIVLRSTALFAVIAMCCLSFFKLYRLTQGLDLSVHDSFNNQIIYLVSQLFLLFFAVFAVRTVQSAKKPDDSIQWFRALGYLSFYQSLIFSLFAFASYLPEAESEIVAKIVDYGLFSVFVLIALLSAEMLTATVRSMRVALSGVGNDFLPVPFFIAFFAAEESIKTSLIKSIETISGVNIARSEIVAFGLRIFEPVLIFTLFAVWLITTVVIVPPDQEAVFRRFGQITGAAAARPGVYFKLPWPFSTAELHNPYQVRTLNVGFEPDPGQRHIIWTRSHAINYFNLIVGDGVEIISIDCQLMYRIDNLLKFVSSLQNPDEFISAAAYRHLTLETISARSDEIIARDRKLFADQLRRQIQKDLDAAELGVSIVEIVFLAMHPPTEVAGAFEDIISAQIDKLTYVLKANTENTHKIFMSRANAKSRELEAHSYAANVTAKAAGESSSFASRAAGFESDPDLEKFRLKLDRMQRLLAGKPIYVVDKTLLRSSDKIYLNLQNW